MVEITLFRRGLPNLTAIVDDVDADLATLRWHAGPKDYAVRNVRVGDRQRRVWLHRVILERMVGPLPPGMQTDHRNRIPLDNRRANLRALSHQDNMRNRGTWKNGGARRSVYRGVSAPNNNSGHWEAHICIDRHLYHLGTFDTEEEAARAYDAAARARLGEMAQPNFP